MTSDARWRLGPRAAEIIDRSAPLEVSIDGGALAGYRGDTAASLLASHGRRTFFGSLHEQRPGGVRSADRFDRGGWVWVAGRGLVPAAGYDVRPGDVLSPYQRRASTPTASAPLVRRHLASRPGVGRLTQRARSVAPPWLAALRSGRDRVTPVPGQRAWFDVAVVGGGVAGLSAALAAANEGASVVVIETDVWLGGFSRWAGNANERRRAIELAHALDVHPHITVLTGTTAVETGTDGVIIAVQRAEDAERIWVLPSAAVVLAAGTMERPLPFSGDHLPGVMTPYGVRRLIELWAVRPGDRALVASDARGAGAATQLAVELVSVGIEVADVVVVAEGAGHIEADGGLTLEEVVLPNGRRVAADLLVSSFGSMVECALVTGLGGVVTRLPDTHDLVIGDLPATSAVVGAMAGFLDSEDARAQAEVTAAKLARLVLRPAGRHRVAPPPAPPWW